MKILITILLSLLFVQSYFFYDLSKKKTALHKEYEDSTLAINYHKKKNLEMVKEVQLAKNHIISMQALLAKQKNENSEFKAKNEQTQHKLSKIKQKNDSQAIIIQQKDNEILILKNELLKYISE